MIVIIMGVSGSGKSTIGQRLAHVLHWEFLDADAFHPPENIAKMHRGIPLQDADRHPWLLTLREAIDRTLAEERSIVLACSALKTRYREILGCDRSQVQLVYLRGTYEVLTARLQGRSGHFMLPDLLQSQFDALEEPEEALWIDVELSVEAIVTQLQRDLVTYNSFRTS